MPWGYGLKTYRNIDRNVKCKESRHRTMQVSKRSPLPVETQRAIAANHNLFSIEKADRNWFPIDSSYFWCACCLELRLRSNMFSQNVSFKRQVLKRGLQVSKRKFQVSKHRFETSKKNTYKSNGTTWNTKTLWNNCLSYKKPIQKTSNTFKKLMESWFFLVFPSFYGFYQVFIGFPSFSSAHM